MKIDDFKKQYEDLFTESIIEGRDGTNITFTFKDSESSEKFLKFIGDLEYGD